MYYSVHGCVRALLAVLAIGTVSAAAAQPGYGARGGYDLPPPPGYRYSERRQCDFYARDQAYRYAPPGAGLHGAARGAVKGAIFGAIVGGSRGARRGAAVGGGFGAIAHGARAQRERDYAYQYAFDDCMRGFRR